MTEAANHPQGAATPVDEPSGLSTGDVTYRPLSLLALAGFGVAALYTLFVVGGGAVSLFGRIPWLMPTWTFLIPLIALILCFAARRRIRNAEGTLSGLAFTTWGARLTVVVALTYAVYYGVTFFAVRLQAQACVEQFFDLLKRGQTNRAFLQAAGAATSDLDDAEIRDLLEVRFNASGSPNSSNGGPYTRFSQNLFVRAIETAGDQARITPLGVVEWYYEQGYRMLFRYHVATPLTEFDMNVATFGRDPKPGEPKGRQWQVMVLEGKTSIVESSMKLLPAGEDFMRKGKEAMDFVKSWHNKLSSEQWDEVYLDTLKPAERERQRKAANVVRLQAAAPLAGLAPLGLDDRAYHDFLAGREAFAKGSLMHIDDKTFWTSKRERPAIVDLLKRTFQAEGAGKPRFFLRMQPAQLPLSRRRDGELTILFDMALTYMEESRPRYVVEGRLAASADEERAEMPSAWRIEAIEPQSGRTAPTGPERPRPPEPGEAPPIPGGP